MFFANSWSIIVCLQLTAVLFLCVSATNSCSIVESATNVCFIIVCLQQMQNGLLPPAIPPLREFDPAFSLLLTHPPMMHGTMSSSMSNTTVSTQPQEV
jgi:hypothetical protein